MGSSFSVFILAPPARHSAPVASIEPLSYVTPLASPLLVTSREACSSRAGAPARANACKPIYRTGQWPVSQLSSISSPSVLTRGTVGSIFASILL